MLRFRCSPEAHRQPFADFDQIFEQRLAEADAFYDAIQPDGLSDDEVRQLLSEQSLERFGQWKRRRGHRGPKACSAYDGIQGPTKPEGVFCSPDDVTDEQVDLYRETQRQQNTGFINEPAVKF